jgi:hypothetical protein
MEIIHGGGVYFSRLVFSGGGGGGGCSMGAQWNQLIKWFLRGVRAQYDGPENGSTGSTKAQI